MNLGAIAEINDGSRLFAEFINKLNVLMDVTFKSPEKGLQPGVAHKKKHLDHDCPHKWMDSEHGCDIRKPQGFLSQLFCGIRYDNIQEYEHQSDYTCRRRIIWAFRIIGISVVVSLAAYSIYMFIVSGSPSEDKSQ